MQQQRDKPIYGIYIKSVLTTKLSLHITEVGKNTKKNLEDTLKKQISNKCIIEGYVEPNSIKILTYSSGAVNSENIDLRLPGTMDFILGAAENLAFSFDTEKSRFRPRAVCHR